MGFDCRSYSKPIRSNRRSCQKLFEKLSFLGGKNGWENILPETQGLVEIRGKKIPKIHSLVCRKGESTFVAAILLGGRLKVQPSWILLSWKERVRRRSTSSLAALSQACFPSQHHLFRFYFAFLAGLHAFMPVLCVDLSF